MADKRDDELVLMHHPDTAAWFECPAAAVDAWRARGWEVADPDTKPAEPNPVVEELASFQAELAAAAEKPAKKAATKSTATKPAPSGDEEKE